MDSFLEEEALPEEEYDLSIPVEQPTEEENVVESAVEFSDLSRKGMVWLPQEDEQIVEFLASNPQGVGTGCLAIWKQHHQQVSCFLY